MKTGVMRFVAAAGVALAAVPPFARAGDEPALRPGLWHFHRLMGKQTLDKDECTDPVARWKAPTAGLAKAGYTQSPMTKRGNVYTFTTACPAINAVSKSIMTIESDSAYTVDITTTMGGQTSNEMLTAKRVGDCEGS